VSAAQARLLGLRVDAARIFIEEGVPLELLVVAEVESGFNPLALSPKGARGPWQLMPATAERFGLRVNELVDERIHPERSTRVAARYLRELYEMFGDWRLALAAYNAGEQRVSRAVERGGTRDFWRLAELQLLPMETRRYVPAILGGRSAAQ
jgi:membrane-bound lytic murein transglycosylase D